jgi:hypothetical protein
VGSLGEECAHKGKQASTVPVWWIEGVIGGWGSLHLVCGKENKSKRGVCRGCTHHSRAG